MRQLADDIIHIPLTPRDGINAYLIEDTLVDAGLKLHGKKLLKLVTGKAARHVLTHAHGDHAGGSKLITEKLGIPMLCGAADAADVRSGKPASKLGALGTAMASFPGLPVDQELREGDMVGSFTVLDTPGHSAGHIALWRESDRVLIAGDVFFGMNIATTAPGLHQPFGPFTTDPELNRASERKLAALEPAMLLLGHGPVITENTATRLKTFIGQLP